MVPFDEIFINPSDLKHVGKLLGRSGGLGVVITVGLHHLCVFYQRFQTTTSGLARRLVVVGWVWLLRLIRTICTSFIKI